MSYFLSLLNLAALFGAIAALQALLLNRMGLAFAAMTAFFGLGAYGVAVMRGSLVAGLSFFAGAVVLGLALGALANRLRHDYFLLATLAILECLGAAASVVPGLGGREGITVGAVSRLGGPDYEAKMAVPIAITLIATVAMCAFVINSATGIAIDRFKENPDSSARWFDTDRLRRFVVWMASVAGAGVGALYGYYQGRVTPTVFSIDFAILVLMFTVLAGRRPILAFLAALLYWALPFWASEVLPFSRQGAADGVRLLWGLLVVIAVVAPKRIEARRRHASPQVVAP